MAMRSASEKRKNIRGRGSPRGGTTNSHPWRRNQRPERWEMVILVQLQDYNPQDKRKGRLRK